MPLADESVEAGSQEQRAARVLQMVFAVFSAGLGILALLGWILGVPILATFAIGKMPMAPSTALLFLLFGTAVFLHTRMPHSLEARRISLAFGFTGTLAAIILLALSLLGIHSALEHLGIHIAATLHGAPIGHMSPLTAFCFALCGCSLLALLWLSPSRRWRVVAASSFASAVALIGGAILVGYLFGAPLLYGSKFIPPALTTSLGLLMLGTALLLSSVNWAWLAEGIADSASRRTVYSLILIFVLASAGIVTVGWYYFHHYEQQFIAEKGKELSAIGRLKVDGLVNWRKERMGDAGLFFKNAGFSALARRYFDAPQDANAQGQLQEWLGKVASHTDWDRVSLLDARGKERMSIPAKSEPIDPSIVRGVAKVLQSGQIEFLDFYRCENDKREYLAILVPVITEQPNRKVGVLALCIDPHMYLYPYIKSWPMNSGTAETLLLRRDGNDALYLNEFRFRKNTALKLRIPLDRTDIPAVKAALGQKGLMEGVDYRGVPVFADMRAVPGSPWFMVSKMDMSEVYAPLRAKLVEILIIISTLMIGTAASLGLLWRQQRVRFYREKSEVANALWEAQERFRIACKVLPTGLYMTDPNGECTYANELWCKMAGLTFEEALGMGWSRGLHPDDRQMVYDNWNKMVAARGEWGQEYRFQKKEGETTWVYGVAAPLFDSEGKITQYIGVNVDITERKKANEALQESEGRLTVLAEQSRTITWEVDAEGLYTYVSNVSDAVIGYEPEELVGKKHFYDIHPEEGREAFKEAALAVFVRKEAFYNMENMIQAADGREVWVSTNGLPILDDDGRLLGYQGSDTDITVRKQAEEALAAEHESAERVLETVKTIIVSLDREGCITLINPFGNKLLGYQDGELLGMNWFSTCLSQTEDSDTVLQVFRQIISGDMASADYHENEVVTRDGERRLIAWHNAVTRDLNGNVSGVLSAGEDITEHKLAEEALHKSHDMILKLTTQVPGVVYQYRLYPDGRSCFPFSSPGMNDIYEVTPEEVREDATIVFGRLHPDDLDSISASIMESGRTLQPYHSEFRVVLPRQGLRWRLCDAMPERMEDGGTLWYGIISDITERKQAEERLASINECLLTLGTDFDENINRLTSLCGELLGATCALYNRLDGGMLCSIGQWNTPPDFEPVDSPDGHICYDVIKQGGNDTFIVRNLPDSAYWTSDPNVDKYKLKTYVGHAVRCDDACVGSLCVVFQDDFEPADAEKRIMGIIASAISTEEKRKRAAEDLLQANAEIERVNDKLLDALMHANRQTRDAERAKEKIAEKSVELSHQATHDALTGLPNRDYFEKQLVKLTKVSAGRKSRSAAVLFIDLDNFKMVNDTMGHKTGDTLLVDTAVRLNSCLREGDTLARMGGDEFAVLLNDVMSTDIPATIAQRMLERLAVPFETRANKLVIGASIGISIYPDNATDAVGLLKAADAAMYKAKEFGRNNYQFFSEEISQANQARMDMERDLRLAIERDEFKVYYQPIVDIRTMRIIGAEALLRWEHPEKGNISPGLFIPVAEETGMIVQMGKSVLETACMQCRSWHDMGYADFEISVNVSPIQLTNIKFVSEVDEALGLAGLSTRFLKLEVTETAIAKNNNNEVDILSILKSLGMHISLDDFGVGYSSLSRLSKLPISHMKIDGYFTSNVDNDKNDRAMTESIIMMAHNLGIKVTAEWVESQEQLAIIRSLGCDYAQGYLISPALPAEAFGDFIRDWTVAHRAADAA